MEGWYIDLDSIVYVIYFEIQHAHYEIRDEDNVREIAGPFPLSSPAYTDPESQVGEQMRLGSYMIDFQSVKEEDDNKEDIPTDVAIAITEKVMKRPLVRHVGPMKRRKPLLSSSTSSEPLLSSTNTNNTTNTPVVIQKEENSENPIENIAPSNYLVNSNENPLKSPSRIYYYYYILYIECVKRSMDDLLSMLNPDENTATNKGDEIDIKQQQQCESDITIVQATDSPDITESIEITTNTTTSTATAQ